MRVKRCLSVLVLLLVAVPTSMLAETPTELIERLGGDLVKGYTQPLVTALGTAMGTGLYNRAGTHGTLGFDFGVQAMLVPVPDKAKTFSASVLTLTQNPLNPSQYDTTRTTVTASTILGPDQTTSVPNGVPPELPGGVNLSLVPLAVPQLSLGLSNGLEAMVRFMKIPLEGDDITFFGFGAKYEITALPALKTLPVDLAAQFAYQSVKMGEIVKGRTTSYNLEASKSLLFVTPYVGLGWESTSFDLNYTFSYVDPVTALPSTQTVSFTVDGENKSRAVLGLALTPLPFVKLNGDLNIGKYTSYGAGLSFSLR